MGRPIGVVDALFAFQAPHLFYSAVHVSVAAAINAFPRFGSGLELGGSSTATAWLCAPSPTEDVGVEIFNAGPAALAVSSVVSHKIASVNRLPWE